MDNNLYHRCRWCHNFDKGKCLIADEIFDLPNIEDEIELAIDDGGFAEAVKEVIESHLDRLREAYSRLDEQDVIDSIVEDVETAVKNLSFDLCEDGLEIKDPSISEHYCKRFE